VSARAPPADRRTALLEATLQLVGEGGLSAVTHRAVERAAGLPHGSTTYYFKTKQQLLEAAVERLLEVDRARADEVVHAISRTLASREPLAQLDLDAIAAAIVAWLEQDRTYQLARYELFVESARRPELKAPMAAGGEAFLRVLEPIVVAAGSRDPRRDARIALAMANGLMLEQLARPEPDFATRVLPAALRKLLASMDEG
jgi:DNA-binding transcriptional regulator YbjK